MATKEQRQNKNFVEKLLQIKGLDYDEWLDEQHSIYIQSYIQNNQSAILEALANMNASKDKTSPNVSSNVNKPKVDSSSNSSYEDKQLQQ